MSNAERIKALRRCSYTTVAGADREDGYCKPCAYFAEDKSDITCIDRMMIDAADALEAADKRIADLEADKKTLINVVKDKSDFHATKDAMRIAELEAQLQKEGECEAKKPKTVKETGYSFYCDCPTCGARLISNVNGEWCAGSFDRF